MKHAIFYKLWCFWHCTMRRFFDRIGRNYTYHGGSRPWWQLCCNGDYGGWRTAVCDKLEHVWRSIEA